LVERRSRSSTPGAEASVTSSASGAPGIRGVVSARWVSGLVTGEAPETQSTCLSGYWSIPFSQFSPSGLILATWARYSSARIEEESVAAIELERVTKEFSGGVVAVDDISLVIEDGEFMVLVGPSGCGKSTLMRAIAGLETVSAGRISIGGKDVTELAPRRRDVAMVFQSYALYPHMTVRQNLGYGLKVRRTPKREIAERVARAAELLGLDQLLDRKPAALSGGQRQRVAMGRAIVREPKAFLMDEPLSNLDAKLRVSMRAQLAGLHGRLETTTLYVTHA